MTDCRRNHHTLKTKPSSSPESSPNPRTPTLGPAFLPTASRPQSLVHPPPLPQVQTLTSPTDLLCKPSTQGPFLTITNPAQTLKTLLLNFVLLSHLADGRPQHLPPTSQAAFPRDSFPSAALTLLLLCPETCQGLSAYTAGSLNSSSLFLNKTRREKEPTVHCTSTPHHGCPRPFTKAFDLTKPSPRQALALTALYACYLT